MVLKSLNSLEGESCKWYLAYFKLSVFCFCAPCLLWALFFKGWLFDGLWWRECAEPAGRVCWGGGDKARHQGSSVRRNKRPLFSWMSWPLPPPPSIWSVRLQPQSVNRLIQSVDQSRSAVAIKSPEGQPESQVIPKIVDKGGEELHQVSFVS